MVLGVAGTVGSRTGWNASRPGGRDQVGVFQRGRIAGGGVDRETEEVCDGSEVAACGIDLVEDAVLAQLPEGNAGSDRQAEPDFPSTAGVAWPHPGWGVDAVL